MPERDVEEMVAKARYGGPTVAACRPPWRVPRRWPSSPLGSSS